MSKDHIRVERHAYAGRGPPGPHCLERRRISWEGALHERFTCDIGDYGKYSLLKALVRDDLRLGVVWYVNPRDRGHDYLLDPRFRDRLDPDVYDALGEIQAGAGRRLAVIEQAARGDGRVLPAMTSFYAEPVLPDGWVQLRGAGRRARLLEWRRHWLEGALQATASADVVFLDPDNGLKEQTPGGEARAKSAAAEYAFVDELDPFLRRRQSLVVYQHQTRAGDVKTQARTWLRTLGQDLGVSPAWAIIFRLGLVRVYFVLPSERHREILRQRGQYVGERWGRYVDVVRDDETS